MDDTTLLRLVQRASSGPVSTRWRRPSCRAQERGVHQAEVQDFASLTGKACAASSRDTAWRSAISVTRRSVDRCGRRAHPCRAVRRDG